METNPIQNDISRDNQILIKQVFETFNKNMITELSQYDWKNEGIKNLPNLHDKLNEKCIEELKEKVQNEEEFSKSLIKLQKLQESMASVYQSTIKFIARGAKKLLKIYTQECYKSNSPSTHTILKLLTAYLDESIISSRFQLEVEQEIKKQILYELQIFLYAIIQAPSAYVTFFSEKLDMHLENIDILEEVIDLSKCKWYIFKIIVSELSTKWPNAQNFINMIKPQFMDFLLFMNMKMAAIFNQNSNIVLSEIEKFKKKTENVKLSNQYILIGLLKELSKKLYELIQNDLIENTMYCNIDPDIVQKFATFIIEKHELYTMYQGNISKKLSEIDCDSDRDDPILKKKTLVKTESEIASEIENKLYMVASKKEKICIQKIFKENGKTGYLVETEKGRQYVIHRNEMDEVVIVNSKFIQGNWKLQVPKNDKDKDETSAKRERLEAVMKNDPLAHYLQDTTGGPPPDLNSNTVFVSCAMGNVGASLGYCLANINKYKSTSEFMQDFGFNATVNGTITLLAQRIPIIGTLLLIGGLGWTSLKLYENKTANNKSKMNKAGKIALSTGTSIGGSIGGAILGQAIIPVPVLGALVGGFIGGLIGGTSTSLVIGALNKKKYIDMIKNLEKAMEGTGYWDYTRSNLNIYGITNNFFRNTIPKNLIKYYPDHCGNIWLTMNTYCLITLYYAAKDEKKRAKEEKLQKEQEEKEEKIKQDQLQKEQKEQKKRKKIFDNDDSKNNHSIKMQIVDQDSSLYQQSTTSVTHFESDQSQVLEENYLVQSDIQELDKQQVSIESREQGLKQQPEEQQTNKIKEIISDKQQKLQFQEEYKQDPKVEEKNDKNDQENEDVSEGWPISIIQPQLWLMQNQYYIQDYIKEIETFVKKVMADT